MVLEGEVYTVPARCRVCGERFMARYNVASRAKVCTRGHECTPEMQTLPSGKTRSIPCKDKCCRSQYAQGQSATLMDQSIDESKVLSAGEFPLVMGVIRTFASREKMPLLFIAATGCRLGEALLVYPDDLNLRENRKGRDFASMLPTVKIPTLKRKGRPIRTVDITDYRFSDELYKWAKERPVDKPLFDASRRNLQKKFKDALKEAKLSKSGAVHILRHTRASQLIRAGCELPEIRRLLGWASLEMLKIYAHTDIETRREVGKNLPTL